jgi:hypothetical protein
MESPVPLALRVVKQIVMERVDVCLGEIPPGTHLAVMNTLRTMAYEVLSAWYEEARKATWTEDTQKDHFVKLCEERVRDLSAVLAASASAFSSLAHGTYQEWKDSLAQA